MIEKLCGKKFFLQSNVHAICVHALCESSHCCGEEWSVFGSCFSWFLGRNWRTNGFVPLIIDCCSSDTIATCSVFPKNRQSFASCASNFCWIWFILKHPYSRLLFTFGLIRINPRCHRLVSKHRDRIFEAFLSTNRHKPFFKRLTNCVGFNANKFFWQSNVHAILNVCWSH